MVARLEGWVSSIISGKGTFEGALRALALSLKYCPAVSLVATCGTVPVGRLLLVLCYRDASQGGPHTGGILQLHAWAASPQSISQDHLQLSPDLGVPRLTHKTSVLPHGGYMFL